MLKWKKEMRRKNFENIHLLWPTNKKITNLFKHTNIGIAFRNTNTLQQFTKPKTQYQTEHKKSGVYKQCNICYRSYIRQTSCSPKLRFHEHTRYIKHNEPQSAYARHPELQKWIQDGTTEETMTLLKHRQTITSPTTGTAVHTIIPS